VKVDAPWMGQARVERLENGLTVCLLPNHQAPLVTSALWYRAGARDETPVEAGAAHFLEHMMFKGSPGYGPGEIDRRTQALGGSNNAFTSHDATAYYFSFAHDRWREGIAIDADRMAAVTLDPGEVESERAVILEEIAMYESEPWDALEEAVQAELFGTHPYGRPVLGRRESLAACDAGVLRDFHGRFYRPDNAVLVLAGDLAPGALDLAARSFQGIAAGAAPRPTMPRSRSVTGVRRLVRAAGEVSRVMLALSAPTPDHPDHPTLRLLVTLLTTGRSSRLVRELVEESQCCLWLAGDLSESPEAGCLTFAAELMPDAEPMAVEEQLWRGLRRLAKEPPTAEEMARARRLLAADWVFAHERVHQQALTAGFALALYDLEHPLRSLRASLAATAEDVMAVAARYIPGASDAGDVGGIDAVGAGGVIGWSLPTDDAANASDNADAADAADVAQEPPGQAEATP